MNGIFYLVPVFMPLIFAALMIVFGIQDRKKRNIIFVIATAINAVIVWSIILGNHSAELTLIHIGTVFVIKMAVDSFGCFFAGLTSTLWVLATVYATGYMKHEEREGTFMAFYLMSFGITEGICFSGNLFTMFMFYELLTLITMPLVIHKYDGDSMVAGRRYCIYSFTGSSLALIATILVSATFDADSFIPGGFVSGPGFYITAFVAIFGFGVKACLFPMHKWIISASVAPTPVTALLHAVAVVKAGIFTVIRIVYYVFGTEYLRGTWVQTAALSLAIFTILFGAAMAVKERHFKRRLAYSTVSNLSYILFGVLLMSPDGLAAGMTHMLFHAVIKICAFAAAGAFMVNTGKAYIYELDGIGRKMPITFACFTCSAISLVGIPVFCGFVSKWKLCSAGVNDGSVLGIVGVIALVASAFLCAIYMFSISVRAFFPKAGRDHYVDSDVKEACNEMLIPMIIFTAANLGFGLFGKQITDIISAIASTAF